MHILPEDIKNLNDNQDHQHWLSSTWKPMMGWQYMLICLFDFFIAPIAWATLQAIYGQPITQWHPITLEGAGLYHIAMGAIIGINAWTRTQERVKGLVQRPPD